MAFIEKKDPIVINIKLTSKGRELLSQGLLDFKYFAVGDSEMDYEFNASVEANDTEYSAFDSSILKPVDKNPQIISFISRNLSGDSYVLMPSVPISAYSVENQVEPIGFFTNSGATFITDSNHVKQPDAMVQVNTLTGGSSTYNLRLLKAPTYGTSGAEPQVGDILFIKWTFGDSTTGTSVNKDYPTPNLFYRIDSVNTGSLGSGSVQITVDRQLPNFTGMGIPANIYAGAMILYNQLNFSGGTVINWTPTEYLSESVLSFLENSQCPTVIFPFWNMSIIFTEEIAGVQASDLKYTQFNSRAYGGFVSYIQNQAPVYKKLGVIHYTNSSPANVYAEGFLLKTLKLEIPTIMWHKSSTAALGATFIPYGSSKILSGDIKSLNTTYYDLVDQDDPTVVVGKVFNELKLVVIEDKELLFAMSYKSNRSWTLPDFLAGTTEILCPQPAPTVTWKTPTVEDVGKVSIVSQCYCYQCNGVSSGWIPFPVGGTCTLTNVVNTGYKVTGCACIGSDGGRLCLNACDFINSCCLATATVYPHTGTQLSATISNVNHTNNYCFGGNIDED